jgi:PAS domain S-box-containing protein
MNDQEKTKQELLSELNELRQENKALKDNQRILDAIMEYTPEGITIADALDITVRRVSAYGRELAGLSPEGIEGIPNDENPDKWGFFRADGTTVTTEEMPLARTIQTGEVICNEKWLLQRQSGKKVTVLCNAGPIRGDEGNIIGGLMLWRDIAETKQVQEAVQKARHELEMKVKEHTAELSKIIDTLKLEMIERQRVESALSKSEDELHHLAAQLLSAQESERLRISYELHDDVGQSLIVLKLGLSSHQRDLPADLSELREKFSNYIKQLSIIIEKVRSISRELHPSGLEDLGLNIAINNMFKELEQLANIKVSLEMDDVRGMFPLEKKIIIYRIFQELFTNIAKHANPTQVAVAIKKENGSVIFRIKDNGKGFDIKNVKQLHASKKGLGLASIEERVRMLDGVVDIWSQPDQGTKTEFVIPISGSMASINATPF